MRVDRPPSLNPRAVEPANTRSYRAPPGRWATTSLAERTKPPAEFEVEAANPRHRPNRPRPPRAAAAAALDRRTQVRDFRQRNRQLPSFDLAATACTTPANRQQGHPCVQLNSAATRHRPPGRRRSWHGPASHGRPVRQSTAARGPRWVVPGQSRPAPSAATKHWLPAESGSHQDPSIVESHCPWEGRTVPRSTWPGKTDALVHALLGRT